VQQSFPYFVGIDWGTQTHRFAMLNGTGRPVEQYNADHSGEGLVTLIDKLKQRTACEPALSQSASRSPGAPSWKLWSKLALPYFRSIPNS
jgi:hypothetical protein